MNYLKRWAQVYAVTAILGFGSYAALTRASDPVTYGSTLAIACWMLLFSVAIITIDDDD